LLTKVSIWLKMLNDKIKMSFLFWIMAQIIDRDQIFLYLYLDLKIESTNNKKIYKTTRSQFNKSITTNSNLAFSPANTSSLPPTVLSLFQNWHLMHIWYFDNNHSLNTPWNHSASFTCFYHLKIIFGNYIYYQIVQDINILHNLIRSL